MIQPHQSSASTHEEKNGDNNHADANDPLRSTKHVVQVGDGVLFFRKWYGLCQ